MAATYLIEPAREADIQWLPQIERAAVSLFEPWHLPESAFTDTTSLEEFRAAHNAGLLWVARSPDEVVGFALVELLHGQPHLEEIDVHPSHGRRGVGRALVSTVLNWARAAGYRSITLTTFSDVPWNAPFYERLGFCVLDPSELTPELDAVVREETARGLDRDRRVIMRCELTVSNKALQPTRAAQPSNQREPSGSGPGG